MLYVYEINFRGNYQYVEDETKIKYFINSVYNIVAENIENAKEKFLNDYWKYVDGIISKHEIILSDITMQNAIQKMSIDIN